METALPVRKKASLCLISLKSALHVQQCWGSVLKRNRRARAAIVESKCSNDIDYTTNLFSRWNLERDEDSSLLIVLSQLFIAKTIKKVLLILVSVVWFSLLLLFA